MKITPRPKSTRSRLVAAAESARRRWEGHCTFCGRCWRSSIGLGEACAEGRDLERDARQAMRRAA